MKRKKAIVIYSVLIILCLVSIIDYMGLRSPAEVNNAKPAVQQAAAVQANKAVTGDSLDGELDLLPEKVRERVQKSSEIPSPTPVVGIGRGEDHGKVTSKAIENAGGLKDIVKNGDTVLIKPNLINGYPTGSAICTDPRIVQQIADMAKACGAAKIIVAEASMSGNVFKLADYDKITDVELVDMNQLEKKDCYLIKPEKSATGKALYIPKMYMDADVVICAAKLKTHFQPDAVVTLSLKNSIGVPSNKIYNTVGYKNKLHELGLKEVIVDLNKIRRPDFVVIDGILAGEGYGPLQCNPVKANIVFAGVDPVAVDTIALNFMGFTIDQIPHVKLASDEGLGVSDLGKINIVGAVLDQIKMKFKPAS
ncbi:MAG TPA: DUF362 domain-containing protein [Patescibacteria group bacterium]|nr:DUF362 domain-containing protein [Patescibacteria group bacterium]